MFFRQSYVDKLHNCVARTSMYVYYVHYVCTYECMHVCMYVCMYVSMYVCMMYVCMCVCMYVCTDIYAIYHYISGSCNNFKKITLLFYLGLPKEIIELNKNICIFNSLKVYIKSYLRLFFFFHHNFMNKLSENLTI